MGYRDRLYAGYVSTHTAGLYGEATRETLLRQHPVWRSYFGRFLPLNKNARILDIGCGDGGFVDFLHALGYVNATGVDISREQVDVSLKLGINGVSCGGVEEYLSGRRGEYEMIFARDVIEHLDKEEVLNVFDLVHQALVVGGKFVVQVPNGESPMCGRIRYGDFTHESAFSSASIRQVYAATGYDGIECHAMGPARNGAAGCVRWLLWKAIELGLRSYLFIETGARNGIFTQNLTAIGTRAAS